MTLQEVAVVMKRELNRTIGTVRSEMWRTGGDDCYVHTVLLVTPVVGNGIQSVIDITGAQFGIPRAWYPWHEYKKLYCERIMDKKPMGTNFAFRNRLRGVPNLAPLFDKLNDDAFKVLNSAIEEWSRSEMISIQELLKLTSFSFVAMKTKLMAVVENRLERYRLRTDHTMFWEPAGDAHTFKIKGDTAAEVVDKLEKYQAKKRNAD